MHSFMLTAIFFQARSMELQVALLSCELAIDHWQSLGLCSSLTKTSVKRLSTQAMECSQRPCRLLEPAGMSDGTALDPDFGFRSC